MRFNNFLIELKRKVMSYFSNTELCDKVVPVSKEWNLIANDSFNWRELEFYEKIQCLCCVEDILRRSHPDKITFYDYKFDSVTLPIINSVKQLFFRDCKFPNVDALRLLVKSFPNTRQLMITKPPEFMCARSYWMYPGYEEFMDGLEHGLEYLQQLKNLQSILLFSLNESIFNKIVVGVVKLDLQLKELYLSDSGVLNDSTLKTIIEYQGEHLRKFTMCFDSISANSYRELINFRNLTQLALVHPNRLRDSDFVEILQELNHLTSLRVQIQQSRELFSKEFVKLLNNVTLPQLVYLFISRCSQFSNCDLESFVKSSPLLKTLKLSNLPKINNDGLRALCKVGSNLKKLHLYGMKNITKECLTKISRELPNLCEVVTYECPLVSDDRKHCIIYNRFVCKSIPSVEYTD